MSAVTPRRTHAATIDLPVQSTSVVTPLMTRSTRSAGAHEGVRDTAVIHEVRWGRPRRSPPGAGTDQQLAPVRCVAGDGTDPARRGHFAVSDGAAQRRADKGMGEVVHGGSKLAARRV